MDTAWGAEPEENWGLLTLSENGAITERRVPPANCDYRDFYANLRDAMLGKAELAMTTGVGARRDAFARIGRARAASEQRTVSVPATK